MPARPPALTHWQEPSPTSIGSRGAGRAYIYICTGIAAAAGRRQKIQKMEKRQKAMASRHLVDDALGCCHAWRVRAFFGGRLSVGPVTRRFSVFSLFYRQSNGNNAVGSTRSADPVGNKYQNATNTRRCAMRVRLPSEQQVACVGQVLPRPERERDITL